MTVYRSRGSYEELQWNDELGSDEIRRYQEDGDRCYEKKGQEIEAFECYRQIIFRVNVPPSEVRFRYAYLFYMTREKLNHISKGECVDAAIWELQLDIASKEGHLEANFVKGRIHGIRYFDEATQLLSISGHCGNFQGYGPRSNYLVRIHNHHDAKMSIEHFQFVVDHISDLELNGGVSEKLKRLKRQSQKGIGELQAVDNFVQGKLDRYIGEANR
eukprot:GHVH01008255.1.p1 GENE.GHVH01008255.1~~GHVH01008255.1.p1  ORF type:complete len:216 (+),score=31.49 GHVH01008255.1:104-751(+)